MDGVVEWAAGGAAWLVKRIAERRRSLDEAGAWTAPGSRAATPRWSRLAIALAAAVPAPGGRPGDRQRQDIGVLLRALGGAPARADPDLRRRDARPARPWRHGLDDGAACSQSSGDAPEDAFRSIGSAFVDTRCSAAASSCSSRRFWCRSSRLRSGSSSRCAKPRSTSSVAFLPLTFVAIVWRPTTVWCRRLTEGLVAIILSKFALAVAFTLAAGALGEAGRRRRRSLRDRRRRRRAAHRRLRAVDPAADDPDDAVGRRAGRQPSAGRRRGPQRARSDHGHRRDAHAHVREVHRRRGAACQARGSAEADRCPPPRSRNDGARDVPVAVIPDPPEQPSGRSAMAPDERQERRVPLRPDRASRDRRQLPRSARRSALGGSCATRRDAAHRVLPSSQGMLMALITVALGARRSRSRRSTGARSSSGCPCCRRHAARSGSAASTGIAPDRASKGVEGSLDGAATRPPASTAARPEGLPVAQRAARRRQRARRLPRSRSSAPTPPSSRSRLAP